MPRIVNPGDIKVGPGKEVPGESSLTLSGPGMGGIGPNIGEVIGGPGWGDGGADAALKAHILSHKAHPADAIYTGIGPPTLTSPHVEGQLDELAGDLPPEPPKFGYVHNYLAFSGIPDWATFKMRDTPLSETVGGLTSPNDAADIFPYYYTTPTPTMDPEFTVRGNDPQSDINFVSGTSTANMGQAAAGGYTRLPAGNVIRTTTILRRFGVPNVLAVGGALYPADRGVLALFHWPPGGDVPAFKAQDLLDRCKGAILLGQGILGDGQCVGGACDGGPGLLFGTGLNAAGDYDPFAYPGQATGQYDLREIANGVSDLDGSPLKSPFDDLDGDGNPGWQRVQNSNLPGPGQVRLGTDPDADKGTGFGPVKPYGIPILGGDQSLYSPVPPSPLGDVLISPPGAFYFRYRLPYLDDYSQATGIQWTPGGIPGTETAAKEKARYFQVPAGSVLPVLAQAGNYDDFPGTNYAWQVARFRIGIQLKYTGLPTDSEEHGTYFFVHFKKEADFEAFTRDGIMPDDATNGYDVYSAWLAPTTAIEDTENRVNEETSTTVFAPAGPAPTYGYKALPYHTMRVNIFEDPKGYQIPDADVVQADSTFSGAVSTMKLSGLDYWLPRDQGTGLAAAQIRVDTQANNFWQHSYRTDDMPLSVGGTTAPAILSSPNPAFIGLAPFAYEAGTFSTVVGAAGTAYTPDAYYLRAQRLEIPFTHLDGAGAYSDVSGPPIGDPLQVAGVGYAPIVFSGDPTNPTVSGDARARVYLRLPRGNTALNADNGIQPINVGTGLGQGVYLSDVSGDKILYHSTSFDPINLVGTFGNFRTGGTPSPAYAGLETMGKDSYERFLDEVYRWRDIFPVYTGINALCGTYAANAIYGPGMNLWVGGPIETPVRLGTVVSAVANWDNISFLQNGRHLVAVSSNVLQVAGLPDRNPTYRYGQAVPFPSAGILMYPHKDYTVGYSPAGFDYSGLTGVRKYTRCFNAKNIALAGQPFLTLRIDGIQLQDFAYTGAGPGTLTSTEGIAILVKVPGLTTWMDVGRVDGGGPSKQDVLLDGAGCQVIGTGTFDGVDPVTQHVYAQVLVNVGPVANLFASTGLDGSVAGDIPILVQVRMDAQAAAFNLEQQYDPTTKTFGGVPAPGTDPKQVRGIIGIGIVAP